MRKKIVSILVVIAFLIPLVLLGKTIITVKKIGSKKSAVTFNHKKHKKYQFKGRKVKCKDCHHKGKMKDSCSKCHTKNKKKGKKAMHKNCIKACHKAQKKGPRKCKACHK